jgi:zinc protease
VNTRTGRVLVVGLALVVPVALSACRSGGGMPAASPLPVATSVGEGGAAGAESSVTPTLEVGSVRLPAYRTLTLDNGARLLLAEKHDVPLVAFTAYLAGGSLADPPGKAGVAAVLAEALQKGAGARSAAEFAAAVDGAGATLSVSPGREAILASGEFMVQDADLMVELLADLLRRPALARDEIIKVRDRAIESIASAKDADPSALIGAYGDAFLFGDHPYGRPPGGDEASIAAITPADVNAYYDAQFGGDRLTLAVVGDFQADALAARLQSALGDWPRASSAVPAATEAMVAVKGRRVLLVDKPGSTQTYFWLGNVGVSRTDPDKAAIDLANTVLGGRFTSILNKALRVDSGLTYGVWSSLERLAQPGSVAISSYTDAESTKKAIDMAIDLLGKYRRDGMDAKTADSAKAYVLGQFPLDLETDGQLARRLGEIAFYQLGDDDVNGYGDAIAGATGPQIDATIARVFPDPADLVVVLVGDAGTIRDLATGYGKVTEMAITDPSFAPGG